MLLVTASAAVLLAAPGDAWAQGSGSALDLDTALATSRQFADAAAVWIAKAYAKRPLVVIGLAGALMLPLLVIAGVVLHRKPRPPIGAGNGIAGQPAAASAAWLVVDGSGPIALPADRDFVQIGRDQDNDICLRDETVHRFHAVIERKHGRGFTITDIGSSEGGGICINGAWMTCGMLADGDTIELGRARLRFATAA